MTAVIKQRVPSLESFEETYKTAYSHGLEAIYSLETVDISTVKKMEIFASDPENSISSKCRVSPNTPKEPLQLEFDLGDEFSGSLSSYFSLAPIQFVRLSLPVENYLIEHGFKVIGDLLFVFSSQENPQNFPKGLTRGFLDEIGKKLEEFVFSHPIEKTSRIDFQGFLWQLSSGMGAKRLSLALKEFGLAELIPLTASEKIELKGMGESLKNEQLHQEALEKLADVSKKKEVLDHLEKLTKVFIAPWMKARGGLATTEEIIERLERISVFPENIEHFLRFFSETFTHHQFPFSPFLFHCDGNLFASSSSICGLYRSVIERALSYFYKKNVFYSMERLVFLLQREFMNEWEELSPDFLTTCLRRSTHFRVFKGKSNILEIHLNNIILS